MNNRVSAFRCGQARDAEMLMLRKYATFPPQGLKASSPARRPRNTLYCSRVSYGLTLLRLRKVQMAALQ
jgi:hypothetical protein